MIQKVVRLRDIGKLYAGGDAPKEFSLVRTEEFCYPIYSNGLDEEGFYGYSKKATMNANTITVSARGTVGAAFYRKEKFLPIVRLITIDPDINQVNAKYLYYYLIMNKLEGYGTSQQQLTLPFMKKRKLLIYSDINYQKRIADILSTYDDLIENNNKRIKILEQMAENLYKEWFVRFRFPGHETTEFENGIPKGWKVDKIKGNIKRLPFNRLYKESELEKEGEIIVIDQSTDEYLGFHNNEPSHFANYEKPIILFGDHSCKFKLMCKDFSLGENVIPFYSSDETVVKSIFLYYSIHKLITTEEYKRHWNRLINMKILMPPVELQIKYSEIIITFIKEVDKLWLQNQNLIKQRDMLLPRLMSGKLEVN